MVSNGLADPDDVGHLLGIGDLIDTLSATLSTPDVTADFFLDVDDPEQTLDEMWRHDAPETAAVLEALGEHLDDRQLAKAARKALFRHRSWRANRSS